MNKRDIIPFLECYERHPCLWNPNEKNYKNRETRVAALKSIIQEMGINISIKDLKLKIKNIRTNYSKEFNKIEESKNSSLDPEGVYVPQLVWFATADRFLKSVLVEGRSGKEIVHKGQHQQSSASNKKKKFLYSNKSGQKDRSETVTRDDCYDEFDVFGQHVANHLRNLPIENAITCQNFINDYLSQERLQILRQNQSPAPVNSSHYKREPSSPES